MRPRTARGGSESGALMMFVLMAILLVGAITVSAMQIIGADVLSGAKEVEADQVYNVAQAGIHYAIGQLQGAGAHTYAGETKTITSGTTTLGTATITVNCIDTGGSPSPSGCGTTEQYRRIISKGTLPVKGPSRTIVAVVKGTAPSGGGGSAICTFADFIANGTAPGSPESTDSSDSIKITGDVGANGNATLTPCAGCGTVSVVAGTGSTGKVVSGATASCGSGCSAAGGISSNQSAPCTAPTAWSWVNTTSAFPDLSVSSGTYTINPSGTGCTQASPCQYGNVTVDNTSSGGCLDQGGTAPWTTLVINTGASGTTTYVQMVSLYQTYGACTLLQITGSGNVQLAITTPNGNYHSPYSTSSSAAQATSLDIAEYSRFGMTNVVTSSSGTWTPVAASRLSVYVYSDGTGWGQDCTDVPSSWGGFCAMILGHTIAAGTFYVPNGQCFIDDDDHVSTGTVTGALQCKQAALTGTTYFKADTSGLSGGGSSSNFNTLLSWKDQ